MQDTLVNSVVVSSLEREEMGKGEGERAGKREGERWTR
jgi:hypothetical protein